jgi:hypothetical protein
MKLMGNPAVEKGFLDLVRDSFEIKKINNGGA